MKQHKWHKEIKAWADGAIIQFQMNGQWIDCQDNDPPIWRLDIEYRIKPQPKEPQYLYAYKMMTNEGLKIQFWDSKTYRDETYIGMIPLITENNDGA